jgi:hypothetical protein
MNARRTPGRVIGDHTEDEFTQLLANAFSSRESPMPREPRPIQLEPCPVPANDSLRLDEDQRPLPSRPEPPQHHPEQFVRSSEPRLRVPSFQDAELLPKSQILQETVAARTGRSNERDEQEPQRTRHEQVIAETY